MRDRLIESIDDFIYTVDVKKWYSEELDEGLADHLLADGWMRPPLKMGDKVWIIDWCYEVNEYEVTHIRYNRDLNGQRYSYDAIMFGKKGADIGFADDDIGNYVFASREEAEKALKGGESDA